MKTYKIKNSFETEYGAALDYSLAYVDDFEFEASSDTDALIKAEQLQEKHDLIYLQHGASDNDFNNAPCYANCIFDENDNKVDD